MGKAKKIMCDDRYVGTHAISEEEYKILEPYFRGDFEEYDKRTNAGGFYSRWEKGGNILYSQLKEKYKMIEHTVVVIRNGKIAAEMHGYLVPVWLVLKDREYVYQIFDSENTILPDTYHQFVSLYLYDCLEGPIQALRVKKKLEEHGRMNDDFCFYDEFHISKAARGKGIFGMMMEMMQCASFGGAKSLCIDPNIMSPDRGHIRKEGRFVAELEKNTSIMEQHGFTINTPCLDIMNKDASFANMVEPNLGACLTLTEEERDPYQGFEC